MPDAIPEWLASRTRNFLSEGEQCDPITRNKKVRAIPQYTFRWLYGCPEAGYISLNSDEEPEKTCDLLGISMNNFKERFVGF
jgi:hypothetical protein